MIDYTGMSATIKNRKNYYNVHYLPDYDGVGSERLLKPEMNYVSFAINDKNLKTGIIIGCSVVGNSNVIVIDFGVGVVLWGANYLDDLEIQNVLPDELFEV